MEHRLGDITDGPRGFYIGYSYDGNRWFDGMMSEVRIWNRILTTDEMRAPYHAYIVEPDSPVWQHTGSLTTAQATSLLTMPTGTTSFARRLPNG